MNSLIRLLFINSSRIPLHLHIKCEIKIKKEKKRKEDIGCPSYKNLIFALIVNSLTLLKKIEKHEKFGHQFIVTVLLNVMFLKKKKGRVTKYGD